MEKVNLLISELQERLLRYDELTILELLKITTEDLLVRFEDKIEENYDKLIEEEEDFS